MTKSFILFLYLIGFLSQILTTTFCNVPCIHYKVKLINIGDTYIHLTLLIIFPLLTFYTPVHASAHSNSMILQRDFI